jgi:hypothetical protein
LFIIGPISFCNIEVRSGILLQTKDLAAWQQIQRLSLLHVSRLPDDLKRLGEMLRRVPSPALRHSRSLLARYLRRRKVDSKQSDE